MNSPPMMPSVQTIFACEIPETKNKTTEVLASPNGPPSSAAQRGDAVTLIKHGPHRGVAIAAPERASHSGQGARRRYCRRQKVQPRKGSGEDQKRNSTNRRVHGNRSRCWRRSAAVSTPATPPSTTRGASTPASGTVSSRHGPPSDRKPCLILPLKQDGNSMSVAITLSPPPRSAPARRFRQRSARLPAPAITPDPE